MKSAVNTERIKKAMEAVDRLTPQQIKKISAEDNFSELRQAQIKRMQQRLLGGAHHDPQNPNAAQPVPREQARARADRSGVRWSAFRQMPVIESKESERDYEKEFNKRIEEFRVNSRAQKSSTLPAQNKQPSSKPAPEQDKGIFAAVYGPQINTIFSQSKQKTQGLFSQSTSDNKAQNPLLFAGVLTNKIAPEHQQSRSQDPASDPNGGKSLFPFAPTAVPSTLFGGSLRAPETSAPQMLKPGSGLFSAENPMSRILPPIFKPADPSKAFVEKKINIFEKVLPMPQPEPPRPVNFKAGSLFSQANPWTGSQKPQDETKTANLGLFSNSSTKQASLFGLGQKPALKESQPVNPPAEPKTNLFSSSNKSASLLFGEPTLKTSVGANQPEKKQNIFSASSGLGLQITTPPSLLGPTPAPEQPKVSYQSGSLFTNSFKTQPVPPVQPVQPPQPAASKSIFSSGVSSSIFEPKSNPKQQGAPQVQSLFGNTSRSAAGSGTMPQLSLFGGQAQQASQPDARQKPASIFTFPQHEMPANSLFSKPLGADTGAKEPAQQAPAPSLFQAPVPQTGSLFQNSTPQIGSLFTPAPKQEPKPALVEDSMDDSQKKGTKKKPTEIFSEFIKSKPDNMFAKPSLFGSSNAGNVFGNPMGAGRSLFGNPGPDNPKKELVSLFAGDKKDEDQDDEEAEGEGDDVAVLEDKEETDPTKSTGNYKYEESQVVYRENVSKLKKGESNMVENVIISIEKMGSGQKYYLYVRLANKVVYFTGTLLAGVTEIVKIKQNEHRNLSIKKIMFVDEQNGNKPTLTILKVQFKEQKQGQAFFDKFVSVLKKSGQ